MGDGMSRFERRNDALGPRKRLEGRQCFVIRDRNIFDPSRIMQICVLGSDRCIIKTRGNGMRQCDLAVLVLQQIALCPLKYTDVATGHKTSCVLPQIAAAAACLDTDHSNGVVAEEWMKQSDRV